MSQGAGRGDDKLGERRGWVEGHGQGTESREGKDGHGREGLGFLCEDGQWNSSSHSRWICAGRCFGSAGVFGWRRWRTRFGE